MVKRRAASGKREKKRSMQRVLIPSGIIQKAGSCKSGGSCKSAGGSCEKGHRFGRRAYPASFTLEAAILVPLILAVIFLLLQTALYLHDSVRASAWLHEQAWGLRWSIESGQEPEGTLAPDASHLPVLRYVSGGFDQNGRLCQADARFEVRLLPHFVTILFTGQPEAVRQQVTERTMDTPAFLKIAGAVLEEMRE